MKRYCQGLTLVDNEEMIRKYVEVYSHVWPEVIAGQREVGILDMQIYRHGRDLFIIMDAVEEFDFVKDMARLATLPRRLNRKPTSLVSREVRTMPGVMRSGS